MKIWHQSYTDLRNLPVYRSRIEAHARRTMPSDVEVHVNGLEAMDLDIVVENLPPSAKDAAVVALTSRARSRGYEATVLGCIYDPALLACRAATTAPVLAMAEMALIWARLIGTRLGSVVPTSADAERLVALAEHYGLAAHLSVPVVLRREIAESDIEALGSSGDAGLDADLRAAIDEASSFGTQPVAIAEGVLHEYADAMRVGGTPLPPTVDVFALMWRSARFLVGSGASRWRRPTGLAWDGRV